MVRLLHDSRNRGIIRNIWHGYQPYMIRRDRLPAHSMFLFAEEDG